MKKQLLITVFCFSVLSIFAQMGNGCTNAIALQAGAYRADTMYANAATNSFFYPFPDRAVWYKYTPTSDGLLTISSCDGGRDTRLFMYAGTCAQLIAAGFSDDFCEHDNTNDELAAKIVKPVKANTTYYLEFDNAWEDGAFTFNVSFSTFTPTATQTCATASTATVGVNRVDSLFGFALRGDANRANWYKYTPIRNGRISVTTCGIDVDTRLWIYRGTCNSLVLMANSDDDCLAKAGDTSAVAVNNLSVIAGTTYYFEFDDAWENTNFTFNLTFDAANRAEDIALANVVQVSPNPATDVLSINVNFEKTRM